MNYPFKFHGGQNIGLKDPITIKFYLYFPVQQFDSQEEYISFVAEKRGIITRTKTDFEYNSKIQIVKLFSSIGGFGVQKKYLTQYFRIDNESTTKFEFRPFGDITNTLFKFSARGTLLSVPEVRKFTGIKTKAYSYYRNQTTLTQQEIRKMIKVTHFDLNTGREQKVRKLRY